MKAGQGGAWDPHGSWGAHLVCLRYNLLPQQPSCGPCWMRESHGVKGPAFWVSAGVR